jgi:hypothetical protein
MRIKGLWRLKKWVQDPKAEWLKLFLAMPHRVRCNVCEWEGRRFLSDEWHPFTVCPACASQVRHRLLVAAMSQLDDLTFIHLARGKRVLHFAPEPELAKRFREISAYYVNAGYFLSEHDIDISNMRTVAEKQFDLLIACDVLEHVHNDQSALQEIHRVLAERGWAIITVPQPDHMAKTFEDPSVTDPKQREKVFGQWDHLRLYGDNFAELLEHAGFSVRIVTAHDFPATVVRKHVLSPPIPSSHPLASNQRRIFFAQKRTGG